MESRKKSNQEYIYTIDTPVTHLDALKAFDGLNQKEKHYVHYLCKAGWYGSLIVFYQTSPESPLILVLFIRMFSMQNDIDQFKSNAMKEANLSEDEWKALLVYVAAFFSNKGNYRGTGDTKFIPDLPKEKLEQVIKCSEAYHRDPSLMQFLWSNVAHRMYSLNRDELSLGFQPNGTTTYWSKNMTEKDNEIVKKFMLANNLEAYNSRVVKDATTGEYVIRFASVRDNQDPQERHFMDKIDQLEMGPHRFRLERGDYSGLLALVNKYLQLAKEHCSNSTEEKMLEYYIRHFRSGSLDDHKQGSRYWIQDKGPTVENYIGFIETYRDPAGERAEFEAFVAIVNKEMSKKFNALVENAPDFLSLLPWPKAFEKDRFLKPDFTSLDVLTLASSGVFCGVNIPNYDEIRQNEGFKNVSLGNVITANLKLAKRNFLCEEDVQLVEKYSLAAFELVVGLHELLGHGSGKLFKCLPDGSFNWDVEQTINPLTGLAVDKWYKHNENYDCKFGPLSSPYEECRSECVALYLCTNSHVLNIFGYTDPEQASKVVREAWLEMVQKGIEGLQMYNASVNKWLQAHAQARYVIARVLLLNAQPLVSIEQIDQSAQDGKADLRIRFSEDINLIHTKGHQAIGDFLLKLQVYKSTGDIESAAKMFNYYSEVSDQLEYPYLLYRDIAIARKKPRQLFVQSITEKCHTSSDIRLKTHSANYEGLIQSYLEHYSEDCSDGQSQLESLLIELWKKDALHFN